MPYKDLFMYLLLNISLLLLAATALVEIRPLRVFLKRQARSRKSQLVLGLVFGLLSISGTYTGFSFQGAVVNTRVVSTLAAGLVGGPLSGLLAGFASGLHRYFYNPDGFTTVACSIGTFCFGVIGTCACGWFPRCKHRNWALVFLVIAAEVLQCCLILMICEPFEQALALEEVILIPKILLSSVGLIAFMYMLDRLNRSLTAELAQQQSLALFIAQKCLPYLREGMDNRQGLQRAMEIVRENLPDFGVILSDCSSVLASSGVPLADDAVPATAQKAMEQKETVFRQNSPAQEALSFPKNSATVAAPLIWDEKVVGALTLIVPAAPNMVLETDIQTANSLAHLFSSMLELGSLQHQVTLRQQAELRALQSQINPHFLFNALNTISALCLTAPERARETILVLANYFRQTLSINEPFVTLEQELSNVNNYLILTEARFEDALHVTWELPEDKTALLLPPLILQPVVENAVRHGGTAVNDRRVHISIRQNDRRAFIEVTDHGRGFPEEVLKKLQDPKDPSYSGLFNVRKRLRSIYADDCQFHITSTQSGSTVSFSVPLTPPGEAFGGTRLEG